MEVENQLKKMELEMGQKGIHWSDNLLFRTLGSALNDAKQGILNWQHGWKGNAQYHIEHMKDGSDSYIFDTDNQK